MTFAVAWTVSAISLTLVFLHNPEQRDNDFGAHNDDAVNKSSTMTFSQTNLGFVCKMMMAVDTSGGSEEIACHLLAFDIDLRVPAPNVMLKEAIGIIGRLECGRTQLEVPEELGIAQSVISRIWKRFQDDGNVSRCYSTGRPRVSTQNEDRYLAVTAKRKRFSLQSDSRRTLIWRAPGARYHQENTIERHRYGGAGWLVWGGIILGSRTDLHVQSVTMTGHIYRDVSLEQHVRLVRGTMGAEFLFMDENAHPHRANIVDEFLQSEDITRMDWPAYSPDLNPIEHVWDMLGRRIAAVNSSTTCVPELRRALLDEWCNIPMIRLII
ncbi:transposable element Tc3 transposase [Trichonephila clavipes]|nr:transposable element Tc3 transposase [Trichonephila clavipes]